MHQALRARRAARHVDVDRQELVGRDERVVVEHPHRAAAGAHRDRPLRLEHLVVEPADDGGHLDGHAARQDDQVGLPGRSPEGLVAEARDVHPRARGVELLHRAAGEPEGEREEGIRACPRDRFVEARREHTFVDVAFELVPFEQLGPRRWAGWLIPSSSLPRSSWRELSCGHQRALLIAPPASGGSGSRFTSNPTPPSATRRRTRRTAGR